MNNELMERIKKIMQEGTKEDKEMLAKAMQDFTHEFAERIKDEVEEV